MTDSINSEATGNSIISRPHPLRNRHRNRNSTQDPGIPTVPAPRYSILNPSNLPPPPALAPVPAATSIKSFGIPSDLPPPYSPPTTRPVNALAIPEILIHIGQCIPLWNYYLELQPQFRPQTFIRCTSVCRQWYQVLKPLFWYLYDDAYMNKIPRETVHKNAHLIRVLQHRHFFGGKLFQCHNLIHLSVVPWITGIEDLIRQNPRLETFTWRSQSYYRTIRDSVWDALAEAGGKLRELTFVDCEVDTRRFYPLLERHLLKLRVLVLHDVTLRNTMDYAREGDDTDLELGKIPRTNYPQIREVRLGRDIQMHGRAISDFLLHCPNIERLVMESVEKKWLLNRTHIIQSNDVLDVLILRMLEGCRKIKSLEYGIDRVKVGGLALLEDGNCARLVHCMDEASAPEHRAMEKATTSSSRLLSRNGSDRDDDDDWPSVMPAFKADMPALESQTTFALCKMENTLQSISLCLHTVNSEQTGRANLLNVHQILTWCRALRHFSLEYYLGRGLSNAIATPTTATVLFDHPWVCLGLETFVIDGIKRKHDRAMDNNNTEMPFTDDQFMMVKLTDLLTLAGLAHAPHIVSLVNSGFGAMLKDQDVLQEKLFHQLACLKNMQQLTFNGDTFRDFSKLSHY
ncbi:hypothetical protein EDD21DRAFT_164800 [Dissophora ornata]|nr:hypothetical protein BGZ58_000187 [Dissophora ornata]KAI8599266.1 hypothetical protein EDD21DRAFT_164800 [Dissophora ornata]